jgi:hypothetical protein
MVVELYVGNYNIDDGLVNGVEGNFKRYTNNNNGLDIVWIEFSTTNIGKYQRTKSPKLYETNILPNLTPIF